MQDYPNKNSDIIIIDDPFENLDYSGKHLLYNLLVSYKKTEKTIICFSNDKEILNIADQGTVLMNNDNWKNFNIDEELKD